MDGVDAEDTTASAAIGSYISGTADLDDYTNSANDVEDCGCLAVARGAGCWKMNDAYSISIAMNYKY